MLKNGITKRWGKFDKVWETFKSKELFAALWNVAEFSAIRIKEAYDQYNNFSFLKGGSSLIKKTNIVFTIEDYNAGSDHVGMHCYKLKMFGKDNVLINSIPVLRSSIFDESSTPNQTVLIKNTTVYHKDGFSYICLNNTIPIIKLYAPTVYMYNDSVDKNISGIYEIFKTKEMLYDEYSWIMYAIQNLSKKEPTKSNLFNIINIFSGSCFSKYKAILTVKNISDTESIVKLNYELPVEENHEVFKNIVDINNEYVFFDKELNRVYHKEFPLKTLYMVHKNNITVSNGDAFVDIGYESFTVQGHALGSLNNTMIAEFTVFDPIVKVTTSSPKDINIVDESKHVARVQDTNTLLLPNIAHSFKSGDLIDVEIINKKNITIRIESDNELSIIYSNDTANIKQIFYDDQCSRLIGVKNTYIYDGRIYFELYSKINQDTTSLYYTSEVKRVATIETCVNNVINLKNISIDSSFALISLNKNSFLQSICMTGSILEHDRKKVILDNKQKKLITSGVLLDIIYKNGIIEKNIVVDSQETYMVFDSELKYDGPVSLFDKSVFTDKYNEILNSSIIKIEKGLDFSSFNKDFYLSNRTSFVSFIPKGFIYNDDAILED